MILKLVLDEKINYKDGARLLEMKRFLKLKKKSWLRRLLENYASYSHD